VWHVEIQETIPEEGGEENREVIMQRMEGLNTKSALGSGSERMCAVSGAEFCFVRVVEL
jgi:hypothetical protein